MSSSRITFVMCVLVSHSITGVCAATEQREFNTAREAADALIQAATTYDPAAAKVILGPDSEDVVSSGRPGGRQERSPGLCCKSEEKLDCDRREESGSRDHFGRQRCVSLRSRC